MKYELIKTDISAERTVDIDDYEITMSIWIKDTESIAPSFLKDIIVVSDNSMTGFQVDEQREQAVSDFMASINE